MIFLSLSVDLWPARNCEQVAGQQVSRSNHRRILSSGFSCLVTEPGGKEILPVTSQSLPMGSIDPSLLFSSNPSPPHHLSEASAWVECKVTLSAFNSKVCVREEVSVIHIFIYLFSHFAAF